MVRVLKACLVKAFIGLRVSYHSLGAYSAGKPAKPPYLLDG